MWSLVSEYLLIKSDSLEIKNFGKFTATNYDATIDSENKILKPAGRKFAFVPVGTKTDEEFIEFATQRLKKSRPEIERMLQKAIDIAQSKLKDGEKVDLPHIGYLFAPDKENPTLVQTAQYSLNPDNFGYTEIELPTAEKTTKQATKVQTTTKEKKSITTKAPKKEKTEKEKKKVTVNWSKIFQYAAIITAIVAVLAVVIVYYQPIIDFGKQLFAPKTTEQQITQTNTQPDQQVKPDQNTQAQQSASTKTQPDKEGSTQQTTSSEKEKSSSPTQTQTPMPTSDTTVLAKIKIKAHIPVGPDYKKYYLIVGSFVKKENAEKFKEELRKEGYPALVLSFGPNRHRVSIGGYDDPKEVIKAHDDYINRHPGKGIWLLIND